MSVVLSGERVLTKDGEGLDNEIDALISDIRYQNWNGFVDALVGYHNPVHVCEDVPRLVRQYLWGVVEVVLVSRLNGAIFFSNSTSVGIDAGKMEELADYVMENQGMYKLGDLIGVAILSPNGSTMPHGALIIELGSDFSEDVVDTEMFGCMAEKVGCVLDEVL